MAKDRNTYAKRERELEKKQKSDRKRERRLRRKQQSEERTTPDDESGDELAQHLE